MLVQESWLALYLMLQVRVRALRFRQPELERRQMKSHQLLALAPLLLVPVPEHPRS